MDEAQLAVPGGGDRIDMELMAVGEAAVTVNQPPQRAGRWLRGPGEIVLDRSLAEDLGTGVGEDIELSLDGVVARFAVVGTAVNLTDCFYPQCDPGRAWVSEEGLARLQPEGHTFAQVWLRFDDAADADPFVQQQAAAGVSGIGGSESWLDTRGDFLAFDEVFGAFVAAFGIFVLLVAAVVVAGAMTVRMLARRGEIALLGAIGCTPRQVIGGLLAEHLFIGLATALVGWILGGWLTPTLQFGIGAALGPQDPVWDVTGLVVAAGLITVILTVVTVIPAVRAARRPITDVLRDLPPWRATVWTRRAAHLPRHLITLATRELLGRPARAMLAALAIAVAVIGTIVSIGFVTAVDTAAKEPALVGEPWDVTVVNDSLDPEQLEASLGEETGVAGWYSELGRRSTLEGGAFLSVAIGGDPGAAGFRIAEGRSMQTAGEAIAGYGLLQRFRLSVGDTVTFLAGTDEMTVRLVGWYRETEDSGEVLAYRLETLTAVDAAASPDLYRVAATPGTSPPELAARLGERFGDDVRLEVIDTGTEDLATLTLILRLVAALLLMMAAANLLTTLLSTSREGARRLGVEQTIGFTPNQLVAQSAVAGALLGVAAVAVAIPSGLWIFTVLANVVSTSIGVGPGWMALPRPVPIVAVASLAVALSSLLGAAAVRRLATMAPAELVRWE